MTLVVAMLAIIIGINSVILFLMLKCMARVQEEEGVRRGRTTLDRIKELNK